MGLLRSLAGEPAQMPPARKLHKAYSDATEGKSSLAHWERILKSRGEADCWLLLRHLLSPEIVNPPRVSMITAANIDSYLAEARENPVATQFPVSRKAAEIAERINTTEYEPIPDEYIAISIHRYEILAKATIERNRDLWYRLTPVSYFMVEWFGQMVPSGRLRDRVFKYTSRRFVNWWYSQCHMVGEYDGEKILDQAKEFLVKSPTPEV